MTHAKILKMAKTEKVSVEGESGYRDRGSGGNTLPTFDLKIGV